MTTATTAVSAQDSAQTQERLVVISCDDHVGPTMAQLRPYCEKRYLDDFDRFSAAIEAAVDDTNGTNVAAWSHDFLQAMKDNTEKSGEHDIDQRLRDLDEDGIAREVIFHGSQNVFPIPFQIPFAAAGQAPAMLSDELRTAGIRTYNRWLADFVSVQPERQAGLVHLPVWDPEACVREVEWAREAGLRGINLPALRPYDYSIPLYNDPVWEPLWAASASLEMPLTNHTAVENVVLNRTNAVETYSILLVESSVVSRRFVPWLIFSGVLERHPSLKVVLAEYRPGPWISVLLNEMDSAYYNPQNPRIRAALPRQPSFYWNRNVYFGASFLSHFEAQEALAEGFAKRLMWGSDYPHIEGSWPHSLASLQKTFEGVSPEAIKDIVGRTAAKLFGFDMDALQTVANRIGPSLGDVTTPLGSRPEDQPYSFAYRDSGPWT